MASKPDVSVIVPVYNVAEFLRPCLDCIVGQTLQNIEIICVDDGSTDDSLAILQEYAASDERIRILQQHNQYAGVARNNGMAQARGDYLVFWDGDDLFDKNALQLMHSAIVKDDADICVCGADRLYPDMKKPVFETLYLNINRIPTKIPFNRQTNEDNILTFTTAAVWNKMFRRQFVEDEHLRFSATKSANDVQFVITALCIAERITIVAENLVTYRRDRIGGLTNTLSTTAETPVQVYLDTARDLKARGAFPQTSFANRAFGNLLYAMRNQTSFASFKRIVECLKDGGLDELGITSADILQNPAHREIYDALRTASVEDVLVLLMNSAYNDCLLAQAQLKSANQGKRKREQSLKKSGPYQIARCLKKRIIK